MKKFLVYLLAIILVASMGFAIFYLVRDNEVISITTTSLHKEVGDTNITVALNAKKVKSYTKIELKFDGDDCVKVTDYNLNPDAGQVKAVFTATTGGVARVNFQTNNSKFRNLYCDIYVGDGSIEHPYYISTPEQLYAIGRNTEDYPHYTADKCYELTSDIDLGSLEEGYWQPISSFSGTFKGNGYSIIGMTIDSKQVIDKTDDTLNFGLFSTVTATGIVDNVVFDNVTINNIEATKTTYIGTVAGVNNGVIKRINVKNVSISNNDSTNSYVGGVVGYNASTIDGSNVVSVARLDRVSANINFYYETVSNEGQDLSGNPVVNTTRNGIRGYVGGITGINFGGTIINSYTVGKATVSSNADTFFGGITYYNKVLNLGNSEYQGAYIKNCYSTIDIDVTEKITSATNISGIVCVNDTTSYADKVAQNIQTPYNQLIGNYYNAKMHANKEVDGVTLTNNYFTATENYQVTSITEDNLKLQTTFVSAQEFEYKLGASGLVEKQLLSTYEKWDFNDVWAIDDSFPYLTYSNVEVSDNIDTTTAFEQIDSKEDLLKIATSEARNNTLYYITADIDMENAEWTPIGNIENPFTGQIQVAKNGNSYFEISNLKVTKKTYEYAGFIGVMAGNASVKGLTLKNITIISESADGYDHTYAGAIVASNGYFVGNTKQSGGSVIDCSVSALNIEASVAVGGIVGRNIDGTIKNAVVTNTTSIDNSTGNTTITLSPIAKGYMGGIVGYNQGTGTITSNNFNKVKGNVALTLGTIANNGKEIYIGGIVGNNENNATIESSAIYTNDGFGINSTSGNLKVGGVAGFSDGRIANCYVSTDINATGTVGGVVGEITASAKGRQKVTTLSDYEKYYNIANCVVYDCTISGTTVGGLVGYMKIEGIAIAVKDNGAFSDATKLERYVINTNSINTDNGYNIFTSVSSCRVEGVTLSGQYNGGLVGDLIMGVVADCSVEATFNGKNNAGFAYVISRNPSTNEAGVITRSYGKFTFLSGNNYQVSTSEVHASPAGLFGTADLESKTAGFVKDYRYTVVKGSAEEPSVGIDWFKGGTLPEVNASDLTKASTWNGLNWNTASWLEKGLIGAATKWNEFGNTLPVQTALTHYQAIIETFN